MRVFIDSSVVLDVALKRKPHYEQAKLLLMLGYVSEFDLWMSPTQISDISHVLEEADIDTSGFMRELRRCLNFAPYSEREVDSAISKDWSFLHSALVYEAALSMKADAIVTSSGLFAYIRSTIPVFTCDTFFEHLRQTRNVDYAEICGLNEGRA
jgi:hypothetical protein